MDCVTTVQLSIFANGGIKNNVISGLQMERTYPILSHIFFADDVFLFLTASSSECSNMMHFLRLYNEVSSQIINLEKSEAFFWANALAELKDRLCKELGIPMARQNVKYLGFQHGGVDPSPKPMKSNLVNKGIPWANWKSMCSLKFHGGMGFRDFSALNQVMLTKQGWRLLSNPQSYWARLYKGLYFSHSTFLTVSQEARGSWAWHCLLNGRDLLHKGTR
ncbi:uncharacterized protein LOC114288363 [Camellia sinensis]|uniref:uncharacterized protein LOC114288363 n=1 Tax=Camellia sinensis TaxID=4442 RepID=UPI001036E17E|nr:uncharacterized protein LOC114288363 [Camellia sinensis]